MVWRSMIIAAYFGLAIVVGATYGLRGFLMLCLFYFCAGAWTAFLLVAGSFARRAGRWNVERLDTPAPDRRSRDSRHHDGELQLAPEAVPLLARRARAARRRPVPAV